MARSFKKLFSLDIAHDYYISGKSHDFIIEPTSDTVKLAKGLRSMIKVQPSDRVNGNTASLSVSFEATNNIQFSEVTLTGTGGTADITVNGIPYEAEFETDLATTAANFVDVRGAALAVAGIAVSSAGAVIKLTPVNINEPFAVSISNTAPNLNGTVADFTPTPLLPITTNQRFRFVMRLNSPGFMTFTDLEMPNHPEKNNKTEVYYYTNGVGNVLDKAVIELRPKLFLYAVNYVGTVDELRVFDADGNPLNDLTAAITASGPDYEISLDLSNYPDGKYTLSLFNLGVSVNDEDIYFDSQIRAGGIFGIIEITKNNNATEAYRIEYANKDATWKYFLVVRDGDDVGDYNIDDQGPGPITFTPESPSAQDQMIINTLLNNIPDGEVVLFVGQANIPYTEQKRKDIQLKKISNVVINHLPNPSVQKPSPDIFVYV